MTDLTSTRPSSASVDAAPAPPAPPGPGLRGVGAQVARDVTAGVRSGGGWFHAVFFFAVFAGFTAFALGPEPARLAAAAPALLWLGALLALQLSAVDLFAADLADGSLKALAAEQESLVPYVAGKFLVAAITAAAPIAVLAPGFLILFAVGPDRAIVGAAVFALGVPALVGAAAAAAALSAGLRAGGLLGAAVSAPVAIPILIFGVGACERVVEGAAFVTPELMLLGALTLIYGAILPPFAVAALRFGLE